MDLENHFTVSVPLEAAWAGLLDIPLVVECLPGATLTETVSPTSYKGMVRVRLGPMAMEFAGKLNVETVDNAMHRATIKATWSETRNRGSATSASELVAHARDSGVDVSVKTNVQLAGQIAQYGRGVGVIQAVSAELVKQFATNLQSALEARETPQLTPTIDDGPVTQSRPKEISSLALLWASFAAWLRGLFATR